jgi:hypothetical protein
MPNSIFLPVTHSVFSTRHRVKGYTTPVSILSLCSSARPLIKRHLPMSQGQYEEASKHYAALWRKFANKHHDLRRKSEVKYLTAGERLTWISGGVHFTFPDSVNDELRRLTRVAQDNYNVACGHYYTGYTSRKAAPEWLQFDGVMVYSHSTT